MRPPPHCTVPLPSSDLIAARPRRGLRGTLFLLAGTTGRGVCSLRQATAEEEANSRADDHGQGWNAFSRFNAPQNESSVTSAYGFQFRNSGAPSSKRLRE